MEIKLLNGMKLPQYATNGSAGLDLCLDIPSQVALEPGDVLKAGTGVAIHIKDTMLAGIVLPRSSIGCRHGIILRNNVGLIDSDYQGELILTLYNTSDNVYVFSPGDRVAQLVIIRIDTPQLHEVDEFTDGNSDRGVGGWGSTGI